MDGIWDADKLADVIVSCYTVAIQMRILQNCKSNMYLHNANNQSDYISKVLAHIYHLQLKFEAIANCNDKMTKNMK